MQTKSIMRQKKYHLPFVLLITLFFALTSFADEPSARVFYANFENIKEGKLSDSDVAKLSLTENAKGVLAGKIAGKVAIQNAGPTSPRYPDFGKSNKALDFSSTSHIAIPDSATENKFRFDQGDTITVETWINVRSMQDHAYIIGKGRTARSGAKSTNQNWAVRLKQSGGAACLNFLFRSRGDKTHPSDWHRWTSNNGFGAGSGWHHVALTYKFGDAKSLRGFIDGREVKGKWDMGGATDRPPVVDDDDVVIGSGMNGLPNNSLDGLLDELAVYRSELNANELKSRFKYVPKPVSRPKLAPNSITVEMFGPHAGHQGFPIETESPVVAWRQKYAAFTRIPTKYDKWGVRSDWNSGSANTMLIRSWMKLELEPGDYQLMVRSRGLARVFIDEKELGRTPAQRSRTGAHHVVDPLPQTTHPMIRPAFMNDHEKLIDFCSPGGTHLVRFEFNVGAKNFCMQLGETALAIAKVIPSQTERMFYVVSPSNQSLSFATMIPLTDEGWQRCSAEYDDTMSQLDRQNRRKAAESHRPYWAKRHQHAKEALIDDLDESKKRNTIDRLISARIKTHNENVSASQKNLSDADRHYIEKIAPIFDKHCNRCHGEKEQGEFSLLTRERILKGGESGEPAVVTGKPHESLLIELVSADRNDYRMPPQGKGLSKAEITELSKWINNRAPMPQSQQQQVVTPALAEPLAFLRRLFIDTIGLPPTLNEIAQFEKDCASIGQRSAKQKWIDRMLEDPRWAENWVGYWQDALAENPNLLKPTLNNTGPFRFWILDSLNDNKPLDQFATELIMMRGSKWTGGAAGFAIASQNDSPMANKSHIIGNAFLGVEMKCARCHDAPYHPWKQGDLFQMAAMLDRKALKLPKTSSVPPAFFEAQSRKSLIEVTLKPGESIKPQWPLDQIYADVPSDLLFNPTDTREVLSAKVTASRRFAEVMSNRIWKRLMGAGIVEPVHDWNNHPPSDPELLKLISDELIESGYNQKQLMRLIFSSDSYQRNATTSYSPSSTDPRFFAGPYRRRMTAEQIVDSALHAAGQTMRTEMLTMDLEGTFKPDTFFNFGYPKRAWQFTTLANERDRPSLALPRAQAIVDVLKAFGWRNSRPEPIDARDHTPNLVQPGVLANGTFGSWLTRLSDNSKLTDLALENQSVEQLVEKMYLQLLTRRPTSSELREFTEVLSSGYAERKTSMDENAKSDNKLRKRYRYVSWSNHLNTEANKIKIKMQQDAIAGDPPSQRVNASWREKAEDAIWALLNSPEMVFIP